MVMQTTSGTDSVGRGVQLSEPAIEQLDAAAPAVQEEFIRRIAELSRDLLPSRDANQPSASGVLCHAEINQDWRFYFTITTDAYCVAEIIPHPK